jgi:hypothetical protein
MNSLGTGYQAWVSAGARLALLVGFFLAPAGVRAECGDYVHFAAKGTSLAGRALLPEGNVRPAPYAPWPAPGKQPGPCTGPLCSRGSFPLPAPVIAPSAAQEHWGCVMDVPPVRNRPPITFLWDVATISLTWHVPTIFHPPRRCLVHLTV